MSQPWSKWFWSDWRGEPTLRLCSLAARGLWVEMLGVMHEAEPYGHLLINGNPLSHAQLASLVGAGAKTVSAGLSELVLHGVCSRNDNGIIFSRRMVREYEKHKINQANGSKGGNPALRKTVIPPDNQEVKTHIPDTRSQKPERNLPKNWGKASEGWTPPRHGATSTAKGRVYVLKGTAEWASYEADFRAAHGVDPVPNSHGGKWFKTLGEADAR